MKPEAKANIPIIIEALKFVEPGEMSNHLFKWLMNSGTNLNERCADIILGAPVSLEHKLQTLKQLELREYAQKVKSALNERYKHRGDNKNPPGTVYRLIMYDHPEGSCKIFNSYDDATEYIRRTRTHITSEDKKLVNHEHGRTDIIEKWVTVGGDEKLCVYWFLDDTRNILYYDHTTDPKQRVPIAIPGRLNFPVPFKPGDIVATDCRPFAKERRVVILENADTLTSVDANNVTCLFLNDNNAIDVGYFKANEFLRNPEATYVSTMYRAATYKGELTKSETPLEIISQAIKSDTKLGNKIFGYLVMQRVSTLGGRYDADPAPGKYYGTDWRLLQTEFQL